MRQSCLPHAAGRVGASRPPRSVARSLSSVAFASRNRSFSASSAAVRASAGTLLGTGAAAGVRAGRTTTLPPLTPTPRTSFGTSSYSTRSPVATLAWSTTSPKATKTSSPPASGRTKPYVRPAGAVFDGRSGTRRPCRTRCAESSSTSRGPLASAATGARRAHALSRVGAAPVATAPRSARRRPARGPPRLALAATAGRPPAAAAAAAGSSPSRLRVAGARAASRPLPGLPATPVAPPEFFAAGRAYRCRFP
jgi:hypothetical protein